jgi:N-methylhydantoinase A/oxoprolinase/acetone carboxylase beta subunit
VDQRNLGGNLAVSPRSAGFMPGPACYNLGGVEPTVTDADVILGYMNPDFYMGANSAGQGLARKLIREKIAKSLGMNVEEAAFCMRKLVDGSMGNAISNEIMLQGHDPRNFVLFSFGRAGPTYLSS